MIFRAWAAALAFGAIALNFRGERAGSDQEYGTGSPPPSAPVPAVDVRGGEVAHLFAKGPTTAGAVVSLQCPACRAALPEIAHRLAPLVPHVSVVRPMGEAAQVTLGSPLLIPAIFVTDSAGGFDYWQSGCATETRCIP